MIEKTETIINASKLKYSISDKIQSIATGKILL